TLPSRNEPKIFSTPPSARLVRSARTSRTRLRSIASAMSPQMARMSASMSSYAAFLPTVSRFGRHLMGAEPRAVSNVEQDDEREDEEGVGQDRVGEEDPEPRAQAQCNPDGGEADAQTIQETASHRDPRAAPSRFRATLARARARGGPSPRPARRRAACPSNA